MTLDDLVNSIPASEGSLRGELARWVDEWKKSSDSLERLTELIEKWHGDTWFDDANASGEFYRKWAKFKSEEIGRVTGMAMNERLSVFGLFELWDNGTEEDRNALGAKVKAYA